MRLARNSVTLSRALRFSILAAVLAVSNSQTAAALKPTAIAPVLDVRGERVGVAYQVAPGSWLTTAHTVRGMAVAAQVGHRRASRVWHSARVDAAILGTGRWSVPCALPAGQLNMLTFPRTRHGREAYRVRVVSTDPRRFRFRLASGVAAVKGWSGSPLVNHAGALAGILIGREQRPRGALVASRCDAIRKLYGRRR